jgi:hypothetical protein
MGCTEETSRIKNVLSESSGGKKKIALGLRKTVYSHKISLMMMMMMMMMIIIIIIQFNSILYYLCAESTATRPIIDTAQCR